LAPDVLKKMESFESGRSVLLERIEEMSQAIGRLTSENRSTREWFKAQLQLLWETTSRRDEVIVDAMKGILEQAEETSRRFDLRDTGDKLMAMLSVPPADHHRSPPSLAPPIPSSSTPTATAPDVPDGESSNKRVADDEPIEPDNKRRKLHEKT
jgi:hypothetical protein